MPRWLRLVVGGALLLGAGVIAAVPAQAGEEEQKDVQIVHFPGRGVYLGVVIEEVEGVARGAGVKEVKADSPAAKAGIKAGDVITRFDGEPVRSVAQLQRLVREAPAGRPVPVEVSRDGAPQKLTATLERGKGLAFGEDMWSQIAPRGPEPPEPPEPPTPPEPPVLRWHEHGKEGSFRFELGDRGPRKLGVQYQPISGQLAKYFHLSDDEGILVVSVDADGPAGKAGMKAGDVILKIEGNAVHNDGDLRHTVRGLEPGKVATITVQREGKPVDLKVTIGGSKTERRDTGPTT